MPPSHTCARTASLIYAVCGTTWAGTALTTFCSLSPQTVRWTVCGGTTSRHNAVNARQNSLKMEPFGTAFNLAKINITKTSSLRHRDERSWFFYQFIEKENNPIHRSKIYTIPLQLQKRALAIHRFSSSCRDLWLKNHTEYNAANSVKNHVKFP